MTIYSVYEPPLPRLRARRWGLRPRAAAAPDESRVEGTRPERFVFVRDGFHVWAFLFPVLWMLRYGLWLALFGYFALVAVLIFGLQAFGASGFAVLTTFLALAILVGLEAGTLRRWTLGRQGWRALGVVLAHERGDAEWRFFQGWLANKRREASPAASATEPRASASGAAVLPRVAAAPDVIGLFPQPDGRR